MLFPNQRYKFAIPNGNPARSILIVGGQEYASGQSRKSDVWRLTVPAEYVGKVEDKTECSSYGAVRRVLANAFCGGDESQAEDCISSIDGDDASSP